MLLMLWLCGDVLANDSSPTKTTEANATPSYSLRRREEEAPADQIQMNARDPPFVPSFSEDDESLFEGEMPMLTLMLRGLDGQPLGENSYDALQTAMNDYLRKRFEDYFEPQYDFADVRTEVVDDTPYEGYLLSGGNAISIETYLSFRDPNYDPREGRAFDLTEIGPRQRFFQSPKFRQSGNLEEPKDESEDAPDAEPKTRTVAKVVPSELELEFAAGYAWNDLTLFRNHLLVTATIENLETFDGIEAIISKDYYRTSADDVEESASVEEEGNGNEDRPEEKSEEEPDEEPKEVQSPQGGNVAAPTGNTLNVSAASSQLNQKKKDRLNPIWPALIVAIAVFLCTIITLGYRKQKGRGKDPFRRGWSGRSMAKNDNVLVHINNDSTTLEGDDEIEVEDQLYNITHGPDPYEQRKKQERDLDKEYAASCLRPAALVLASSTPPSTSAVSDDEEDENSYSDDGVGHKNCFGRRKSNRISLHEQDEIGFESNSSRGINLSRRVDLTTKREKSSWRNPPRLHEDYNDGDLTKKERKKFAKYMEAGMSLEAASSQVLSERKGNKNVSGIVAPSSVTGTRTGELGGYTGHHRATRSGSIYDGGQQSSFMDCNPCVDDNRHSQSPSFMSLGAACSANDPSLLDGIRDEEAERRSNRRIEGTARAMVIAPASSYASSYDDNEFDAAMEESRVEMAMA